MNRHGMIRGAVAAALAMALGACTDGLARVNKNPNAPTDVAAGYILPGSIVRGMRQICCSMTWFDDWAQQTATIQFPTATYGDLSPSYMDPHWIYLYQGLEDIQTVVDKGRTGGHANIEGAGMILRAWLFSQATDLWGAIPYSQALQGANDMTPKYDAQKDVYAGMLENLAAAVSMLGATDLGDDFGGGDVLYGNNWSEWKKFANSLRMRLAMRMSEVDPATAESEFVAAYNDGPFTSNADNAQFAWPGDPYGNPMWEDCICGNGGSDNTGVSATLVDTLTSLNDPRLKFYAEPTTDPNAPATYFGEENGDAIVKYPIGYYSRIGNYWRADGQYTPSIIMDYSEVLFLEAEAALRGWISGDPATLYQQAITAAFQMYTATGYPTAPTAADLTTYLQNPRVVWAGGANGSGVGSPGSPTTGQAQIQLQKWISLYLVGIEAWTNWRRVRLPHLVPAGALKAGQAGITIIPVRLPYPAIEQSLNDANLMAAVQAQGGGLSFVTNMWWDVNMN